MLIFILILLLVAAAFGILGAVLKIAFALILGLILTVTLLAWGGWLWFRHRMREWQREVDRRAEEDDRRRRAVDIRYVENEADGGRPSSHHHELEGGGAGP